MSSGGSSFHDNTSLSGVSLLHWGLVILSPHFDMTRVAHIRGDSTVGPVGPSSPLLGSVDLNVSDHQLLEVELLDISVGFEVSEDGHDGLNGFLWPPTLDETEFLGLGGSSDASVEFSVRNASLVVENLLEVSDGLGDLHIEAGTGSFVGVFEADPGIERSGLDALFVWSS